MSSNYGALTLKIECPLVRAPIVVMILLFVATLFVEPISYRADGIPLSLACVGAFAARVLGRRGSDGDDNRS